MTARHVVLPICVIAAMAILTSCGKRPVAKVDPEPYDLTTDPSRVRFQYDDDIRAIRENKQSPGSKTWQMRYDAEVAAVNDYSRGARYTFEYSYLRDKLRIGMTRGQVESSIGLPAKVRRSIAPGKGRIGPKQLFTNPKTGPVIEYHYRVRVQLLEPTVDDDGRRLKYVLGVVVVFIDGRVHTWHEI